MGLSAAAAGAAVLSPVLDWSAYAKTEQSKGPIGIVGGGVAGLTAAYRLHQAGKTPIVFEASNRWGGRMFTKYDFYKGMFCERGGELVDSNHVDLMNLLKDLGLNRQPLENEGEDLYFFKGKFRTGKDMLDPKTQSGAFVPIAKQIRVDAENLGDPLHRPQRRRPRPRGRDALVLHPVPRHPGQCQAAGEERLPERDAGRQLTGGTRTRRETP